MFTVVCTLRCFPHVQKRLTLWITRRKMVPCGRFLSGLPDMVRPHSFDTSMFSTRTCLRFTVSEDSDKLVTIHCLYSFCPSLNRAFLLWRSTSSFFLSIKLHAFENDHLREGRGYAFWALLVTFTKTVQLTGEWSAAKYNWHHSSRETIVICWWFEPSQPLGVTSGPIPRDNVQ